MDVKKAKAHFLTVMKHKRLVGAYCFRAGLFAQGITHDLSKFSPTEFLVGAKYYQGTRSPNNAEREAVGLSTSWLHHKGRNKHHFEYWIDYSDHPDRERPLAGAKMPRRYVAEMIFDRISAARVYLGDAYTGEQPLKYFLRSKDFCWFIHPVTLRHMEGLLRMWAEKGEAYTVAYIRDVYLPGKKRGPSLGKARGK